MINCRFTFFCHFGNGISHEDVFNVKTFLIHHRDVQEIHFVDDVEQSDGENMEVGIVFDGKSEDFSRELTEFFFRYKNLVCVKLMKMVFSLTCEALKLIDLALEFEVGLVEKIIWKLNMSAIQRTFLREKTLNPIGENCVQIFQV